MEEKMEKEGIKKLVVRFTEQQLELLENLKEEGQLGKTYEEIIVNVFRESIKQSYGKGGA
jgi:hypothetical protein